MQKSSNIKTADEQAVYAIICTVIADLVGREKITPIESIAIMLQLSSCANKGELLEQIKLLAVKYPALSEVMFEEKELSQSISEDSMQRFITFLIKNNRMDEVKAFTEFTKSKPSQDSIIAKFPEFNEFIYG